MTRLTSTLAVLGLCAATGACTDPSQKIMNKEDMMIASGFKFVPANTPERRPRSRSCRRTSSPARCAATRSSTPMPTRRSASASMSAVLPPYSAYRARVFDKKIADEQLTVANDLSYMNNWDWGVWGAGYPYGWPYEY